MVNWILNDKSITFFPTRNGKNRTIESGQNLFLFCLLFFITKSKIWFFFFLKRENDFLLEVCSEIVNLIFILAFSCLPQREIAFLFHAHLGFYNWQWLPPTEGVQPRPSFLWFVTWTYSYWGYNKIMLPVFISTLYLTGKIFVYKNCFCYSIVPIVKQKNFKVCSTIQTFNRLDMYNKSWCHWYL